MPDYTFDVAMFSTIQITADSEKIGREKLERYLDGAHANFGCDDEGDPITADISFETADLMEIDGEAT